MAKKTAIIKLHIPTPELDGLSKEDQFNRFVSLLHSMMKDDIGEDIIMSVLTVVITYGF